MFVLTITRLSVWSISHANGAPSTQIKNLSTKQQVVKSVKYNSVQHVDVTRKRRTLYKQKNLKKKIYERFFNLSKSSLCGRFYRLEEFQAGH